MRELAFEKYEALGNDFVVVDVDVSPAEARALCDRRRGIGADGVLVVTTGHEPAPFAMRVLNADGSEPEMCGNGLRCAALHVLRRAHAPAGDALRFSTGAGERTCRAERFAGAAADITVDMGVVRLMGDVRVTLNGRAWDLATADVGNPHAVTWAEVDRAQMEAVGAELSRHPSFPAGTNVEFARVRDARSIDLVVWERGGGITQACGTGACATVAVAVSRGLVARDAPVAVHLPGGALSIRITDDGHAIMQGPTRHVFSGAASLG